MKTAANCLLGCVVLLCSAQEAPPTPQSKRPSRFSTPAELRTQLNWPADKFATRGELMVANEPFFYDRIVLEQGDAGSRDFSYRMTVKCTGEAVLNVADEGALAPGDYVGVISRRTFDRLCFLVQRIEFFRKDDRYAENVHSHDMKCTMTVAAGETEKVISIIGQGGPAQLLAMEDALEVACGEIEWRRK